MSLRNRLKALKRQTGTAEPPAVPARAEPASPEPALGDRLQRLAGARASEPGRGDEAVARLLAGQVLADGVVCVDRSFPLTHRHGHCCLAEIREAPLSLLASDAPEPGRLLFLDTETTGLAGGTGTLPFLLGLGRIADGALQLRQYFLTAFRGEVAMLADAARWAGDASHLVTFNGKTFDLPLLATRCQLARAGAHFSRLAHIDLLHPTRAAFARRWPDCRLQTAERQLIGFQRLHDFPSHLIPQAWSDFVRWGRTAPLPGIVEHNLWDLVSLAALAPVIARIHAEPDETADPLGLARAHLRRGDCAAARRHLQAQRDTLDAAGLLELAALERREGNWMEAAALWQLLAGRGCVEAMEHLAKYHEHRRRDFAAALDLAERLVRLQPRNSAHGLRVGRLRARLDLLQRPD